MPDETTTSKRRDGGGAARTRWKLTTGRLYALVAGVVGAAVLIFALGLHGMHILAGVRAFVGGESIWSKHEKEANRHLIEYAQSRDEGAWLDYTVHVENLDRFNRARVGLESPDPDRRAIAADLVAVGIHPNDVEPMIDLFRRFRSLEQVDQAAANWADASALVEELEGRADQLRVAVSSGEPEAVDRAVAEVNDIGVELDAAEERFAAAMGDAARWTHGVLRMVMAVFVLLVGGTSLAFALTGARILRRADSYAVDLERRNWVTSSRNEIAALMEGQYDEEQLARDLIGFLVGRLDGQVGAFYTADEDGALRLTASHAFADRKHVVNRFLPGEGLVGQAALERETIVVSELPDDYMAIRSGLGQSCPRKVLVHPLVVENEVLGAFEIATLTDFTDAQLRLVETAAETIAVTLRGARSRRKLTQLLEQTRIQAAEMQELNEELTTQQEELREANEELEQQSAVLEASQAQLEEQQQRLEETNAELEERTEALEKERREVDRKNTDLEEARRVLEEKASELEVTSGYKSEFLANMSHELRTPLNSIIILSKLLSENKEATLSDKQLEFAGTIHDSGTDLLELINQILDLSKIEAGRVDMVIEEFALDEVLDGLRRQFEPIAAESGLELEFVLGSGAPSRIVSDSHRLSQILKNLLSNAIKFTDAGTVNLTVAPASPDQIERAKLEGGVGGRVAIAVRDSGIGVPPDKQKLIFEAFKQADGSTDRKYGGTGLGLAISRELARRLGGDILLDSVPGEGSTFTVLISAAGAEGALGEVSEVEVNPTPVAAPSSSSPTGAAGTGDASQPRISSARVAPPPEDDRAALDEGDRSLLIIEDDAGFAATLRELARERGFKCLVALDGESGLDLAQSYLPSAILLDLGLPSMDGMAVIDRLKDSPDTRHIPVHVISGSERKFESLKAGSVGFLHKPVNLVQLDEAFGRIEDVLSRPVKSLLMVDGDAAARDDLVDLIDASDVEITTAATAEEALKRLGEARFDCVLAALDLPDRPGDHLLKDIRHGDGFADTPVIVVADRELSTEEALTLDRYADRVIRGGGRRQERILDETALFLHRVEQDLPEEQRKMIRMLHDREAILHDRRVLLVDDDMRNVFALSAVLEEKGMEVDVAKNGREALDKLETGIRPDIVLMDIMMPEMDGYEATRRIREQKSFRSLPVIALTAKAMQGDRAKCLAAGASDYVAKPVDTDKLLSVLRVWLCR